MCTTRDYVLSSAFHPPLQAQQACLETLPDVLLRKILCLAWNTRPALLASFEVRRWLSLECVSRRFKRVLRDDDDNSLRLRLDFSSV